MTTKLQHRLAAQIISDYLLTGMHHATQEGRQRIAEVIANVSEIERSGFAVGVKVEKLSGKIFKSGSKVNTIKGLSVNPNTNKVGLTFNEDDSIVDAYTCERYIDLSTL